MGDDSSLSGCEYCAIDVSISLIAFLIPNWGTKLCRLSMCFVSSLLPFHVCWFERSFDVDTPTLLVLRPLFHVLGTA